MLKKKDHKAEVEAWAEKNLIKKLETGRADGAYENPWPKVETPAKGFWRANTTPHEPGFTRARKRSKKR